MLAAGEADVAAHRSAVALHEVRRARLGLGDEAVGERERAVPVSGPVALAHALGGEPAHESGVAEALGVHPSAGLKREGGLELAHLALEVGQDAAAVRAEMRSDAFRDRDLRARSSRPPRSPDSPRDTPIIASALASSSRQFRARARSRGPRSPRRSCARGFAPWPGGWRDRRAPPPWLGSARVADQRGRPVEVPEATDRAGRDGARGRPERPRPPPPSRDRRGQQRVAGLLEHLGAGGLGVVGRLAQTEEQRRPLGVVARPELERGAEEARGGREGVEAQGPVAGVAQRQTRRRGEQRSCRRRAARASS